MTYKEVYNMISGIGYPTAYHHFDEGNASDPPFICFYFDGSDDFLADNENYQQIRPLTIELYTDNKNFAAEASVESNLKANNLVYSRTETYISTERLYMVAFLTQIIITEETENNG